MHARIPRVPDTATSCHPGSRISDAGVGECRVAATRRGFVPGLVRVTGQVAAARVSDSRAVSRCSFISIAARSGSRARIAFMICRCW